LEIAVLLGIQATGKLNFWLSKIWAEALPVSATMLAITHWTTKSKGSQTLGYAAALPVNAGQSDF
jgi:hypothetical protein